MIARRSFLTGLVSLITAPAIAHAGNLMPIKASSRALTDYVSGDIAKIEILYGTKGFSVGDVLTIAGVPQQFEVTHIASDGGLDMRWLAAD